MIIRYCVTDSGTSAERGGHDVIRDVTQRQQRPDPAVAVPAGAAHQR